MKAQLNIFLFSILLFSCQSSDSKDDQSTSTPSSTKTTISHNTLTAKEKATGWQLLFDGKSVEHWRAYNQADFPTKGWTVSEGVLMVGKGESVGDIITKEQFSNFELKIDFLLSDTANSGIFYLAIEQEGKPIWYNAPEYQILDNQTYINMYGDMTTHLTAENYDLQAASQDYTKPIGEWNNARVIHNNGHVEHWLNGNKTIEYQIDSPEWKALVQKSKFKEYPDYGRAKQGYIGLQEHGHLVKFRNIKIRKL